MKIKITLDIPIKRRILWLKMRIRRSRIPLHIKNKPALNLGRDYFYRHLLEQELLHWSMFPESFNVKQFEEIIDRRGFSIKEQNSLVFVLYKVGFDITNLQLVDLNDYRQQKMNLVANRLCLELKTCTGTKNTEQNRTLIKDKIKKILTGVTN